MSVKVLATVLGGQVRQFCAGWIEGRTRYQLARDRFAIPGSLFAARSVERAASDAAVTFYCSIDGAD